MAKISTYDLEDNRDVFPWRMEMAHDITKTIYTYWSKNKKITKLYTTTRNNLTTYKFRHTTFYGENRTNWQTRYFYLEALEEHWYIK